MAPQEANLILADGSRKVIDVDDVEVGSRIAILPGGMIPVDGKVLSGEAEVNEAAVSGESVPVLKINGDQVLSGTRSEEHTSELQSRFDLVCRLLLEKKNNQHTRA